MNVSLRIMSLSMTERFSNSQADPNSNIALGQISNALFALVQFTRRPMLSKHGMILEQYETEIATNFKGIFWTALHKVHGRQSMATE